MPDNVDHNDIYTHVRRAPAQVRIAALALLALTLMVTGTQIAFMLFGGI